MRKLLSLLISILIIFALVSCNPSGSGNGGKANLINVDFYAFNDLHGNLLDSKEKSGGIGISKTTTFIKRYNSINENSVFFSTGDMWQGSSEANNTKGKIVTDWMNLCNFDAMTVGNHEFDWGIDAIKQNAEIANFPILGINVYEKATDQQSDVFESSVLIEKEDVTIGLIGAIGDCYGSISSSKVTDYYFKTGDDLTALVKEESVKLKNQGADIIVYSLHDGYGKSIYKDAPTLTSKDLQSFYDVSLSDGYVDMVFEAHTHQSYVYKDEHGVYHVQASSNNRGISHVDADYNKKTGEVTVNTAEVTKTDTLILTNDEETEALFDKYSAEIGAVYEVLGENYRTRYSEDLEDLVAELYLKKGLEKWGENYQIFLGGGFLRTRSPYDLKAGEVCYKDLQSLFPFDNDIVLCSISGYYLNKQFVSTTNEDYHSYYSEFGSLNKTSIDPNATYYVVVDSYTSDYAPNHLTVIERYSEDGFYARDLLADYVKSGGLA